MAINQAMQDVKETSPEPVPLHLRNAPTSLMKKEGYAKDYKYPHDFPQHFVKETYLPEKLKNKRYYFPSEIGREKTLRERLKLLWKNRYKK